MQVVLHRRDSSVRMPAYLSEHMFDTVTDRIAGTLLMGLDVAVEFATLGEFRVVDPDYALAPTETADIPVPLLRRPGSGAVLELDRNLLPAPATALAQAAVPAPVFAPAPRCQQRRRPAAAHAPEPVKRPIPRKRVGAVQPAGQLCLLAD